MNLMIPFKSIFKICFRFGIINFHWTYYTDLTVDSLHHNSRSSLKVDVKMNTFEFTKMVLKMYT